MATIDVALSNDLAGTHFLAGATHLLPQMQEGQVHFIDPSARLTQARELLADAMTALGPSPGDTVMATPELLSLLLEAVMARRRLRHLEDVGPI